MASRSLSAKPSAPGPSPHPAHSFSPSPGPPLQLQVGAPRCAPPRASSREPSAETQHLCVQCDLRGPQLQEQEEERSGETLSHADGGLCRALEFLLFWKPWRPPPRPLSHCLTIVPALRTAGDGAPSGAGRPLLTRGPSHPTASAPTPAPPGQTAPPTRSPRRPAGEELAPRPLSMPPLWRCPQDLPGPHSSLPETPGPGLRGRGCQQT